MAKLSKQELKALIAEKIEDVELQTELLEDIEDSIDESDIEMVEKSELDSLQAKYDDLSEKYRVRFLEVKEVAEEISDMKEEAEDSSDEVKEEEVIDVQEI